jgi:hypothetical protein
MAQIQKGTTYSDSGSGSQVTHINLNQHVDNATLLIGAIAEQTPTSISSSTDLIAIAKAGETSLNSQTKAQFVKNLTPESGSDLTITPSDATIVTGLNYSCSDGVNNVVTSNAHNLSAGQIVLVSGATNTQVEGTYRIASVTTNDFTYTLDPLKATATFVAGGVGGTTITVTSANHGLVSLQSVTFTTSYTPFNGTYTITYLNANQFTYAIATNPAYGSGSFTSTDEILTTVTTGTSHGLETGDLIIVTATNAGFSGTYGVTKINNTSFSYSLPSAYGTGSGTFSASGTAITVTKAGHNLVTGQTLVLTASNTLHSGTKVITVTGADTFTYTSSGSGGATTGTISYTLSGTTSGGVTFILEEAQNGIVTYETTKVKTGSSGTCSYIKKGSEIVNGNASLFGGLYATGNSVVYGNSTTYGNSAVYGSGSFEGDLVVDGSIINYGVISTPSAPTENSHLTNKKYVDGSANKSTNGYFIMPNGLIMQWGEGNSMAGFQTQTITFPIAFPNACLNVQVSQKLPSPVTGATAENGIKVNGSPTKTSFAVFSNSTGSQNTTSFLPMWFAIGY